jgi:hypothetical protein
MKKIFIFATLAVTTTSYARLCDISPYADLEEVVASSFDQQKECLKSLAFAPTTPPYPKERFQKMAGNEVYVISCNLGEKDDEKFDRFLYITKDGIKSLKYPKYFYKVGQVPPNARYLYTNSQTKIEYYMTTTPPIEEVQVPLAQLPRNVIHFKDGATDYYMVPDIVGQPEVFTADKLQQISQDTGYSLNKIRNDYIKKYEDYLASKGQSSAIKLTLADKDETETLMPCLEQKQQDAVKDYMSAKFRSIVPAYGTIISDHNKFNELPPEARLKYERPWAQLKEMIVKDLLQSNPSCQGVVEEQKIYEAFDKTWGQNAAIYEGIRKRFNP